MTHLRLLPYSAPIVVLSRFFKLHPEPNERTETLLVRWVWRTFLSPILEEKALRRQGVAAVTSDEEGSVQALLALVGSSPPAAPVLPERFDARTARSRLAMLGLAALRPRPVSPSSHGVGDAIDVSALIRIADKDAFRPVFPRSGENTISPANHVLLPGAGSARNELISFIERHGHDHSGLRSHAIGPVAAQALLDRDVEAFVASRQGAMIEAIGDMGARLAEWGRNDRPSIDYLLAQADG